MTGHQWKMFQENTCLSSGKRKWIKSIIIYKMLLYSQQKHFWQIQFPQLKVIYMFRNHTEIERKRRVKSTVLNKTFQHWF